MLDTIDRKKYKIRLLEKDLTHNDVAQHLGLDPATLYRKLNEKSDFTLPELQGLCAILDLDVDLLNAIFFNDELAKRQD